MGVWHGNDLVKPTGGRKGSSRKKRKYEMGSPPTETILGDRVILKIKRARGGNIKLKLRVTNYVNLAIPETGEVRKVPILGIDRNPASYDYTRRKIITRGTIIRTPLGLAKVTSRPGQHGIVNAVLIKRRG